MRLVSLNDYIATLQSQVKGNKNKPKVEENKARGVETARPKDANSKKND